MQEAQVKAPQTRSGEGALAAVVLATAWTNEAFLRSRFGCRYIGYKGPLGLLMIVWPGLLLFRHDSKLPLAYFTAAYIVLWLAHQLNAWTRLWRKKIDRHTLYRGRPRLMALLPFLGENAVKLLEPWLVLGIGYGTYHLNRPLGCYLIWSGLAFLFTTVGSFCGERKRTLDLNDAVAQQRYTAETFRVTRN